MSTATLSVSVPENVAEALSSLGKIRCDGFAAEGLVRDAIGDRARWLAGIATSSGDIFSDELRGIAADLQTIADALDEMDCRSGGILAQVRKMNGWTRGTMAAEVGVDVETVAAWEAGTAIPPHDVAHAMADRFGFSADIIVGAVHDD